MVLPASGLRLSVRISRSLVRDFRLFSLHSDLSMLIAFLGIMPSAKVEGLEVEGWSVYCGFLGPKIWVLRVIKGTVDEEEEVSSLITLPNPSSAIVVDDDFVKKTVVEDDC